MISVNQSKIKKYFQFKFNKFKRELKFANNFCRISKIIKDLTSTKNTNSLLKVSREKGK